MKKTNRMFCLVVLMGLLAIIASSGAHVFAEEGYHIISTEELKQWIESSQKPHLIFSLSEVEFLEERIADSICVPVELMERSSLMPDNPGDPVVFYCKGPG